MTHIIRPQFNFFDFSRRDITCITIAIAIHSLLLLWHASPLNFLEKDKKLGDAIVEVNFVTDTPSYELGGAGKVAAKKKSMFSQVKRFFVGKKTNNPDKPAEISMGSKAKRIENKEQTWKTAKEKLVNKDFKKTKTFSSLKKSDSLDMAKGQSNKVEIAKGDSTFKGDQPKLKSKSYRVSPTDMPFQIKKAKNVDALSNVNAVAVNVGRKTNSSVKSLGGNSGQPKLKAKTFEGQSSGSFGAPGGSSKGDGLIAMGNSGKISPTLATGSGGASSSKSNSMSRRGKSGRTASGTSFSGGTAMASLPRNTVSGGDTVASRGGGGKNPFEIRGALSGRSILNKPLPSIKQDIRATFKFYVDWAGRVLDGIVTIAGSGTPSVDRQLMDALSKWLFAKLPQNRVNEVQEGVITFRFIGR